MEYYALTDIGLVREKNQDAYLTIENKYGDLLILVADGIGGGRAGEVASSELVKYFDFAFKDSGPFLDLQSANEYLSYHVSLANRHIYDLSNSFYDYRGMGTTLTGVLITSYGVLTLNIGDSRVYGFIDHKLFHLTTDHTLVNQMIANGQITPEEAINHPKKHYLVKAVGIFDSVNCDIHKVKNMDYYLICSDGLHGLLFNEEIINTIYDDSLDAKAKCETLKDLALMKGGNDNITVAVVKM